MFTKPIIFVSFITIPIVSLFSAPKYILFGWEFGQTKLHELIEKAPYFDTLPIDGIGITPLTGQKDAIGRPMWSRYLMHTGPWQHEDVKPLVEDFRRLTSHKSMKECFFGKFFSSPTNRIAWTDDAVWARIGQNMRVLARLAKEGGVRGFGIDHEDYFRQEQFRHRRSDGDYAKTASLVRKRARQLFSGVFAEHPTAVIITFWLLSQEEIYFGEVDPVVTMRDRGDLWPAFINGIFDVMPPTAKFVDGDEKSYRYRADRGDFERAYVQQRTKAIRLVAPENRQKYMTLASMAFSVYLDMYLANEGDEWYQPPLNGSQLERLRDNLRGASFASDEYVWFWGQAHCWAKWPEKRRFNGHFKQEDFKRTWEECMNGLIDTIAQVKDPQAYGFKLWEESKKRGALKVMNRNSACLDDARKKKALPSPYAYWQDTYRRDTNGVFRIDSTFGEGDTSSICVEGVSHGSVILPIKGVQSGDWYAVEFSAFGEGVSGDVGWYKNSKWYKASGKVAVVFEDGVAKDSWRKARGVFRVPTGADGFGLIMGVHLMPGEKCHLDNVFVYKLEKEGVEK